MKTKNIIIATCCVVIVSLVIIALLLLKTPKYEVTFTTDNEVYETIEVKEDGTIDEPTTPTKEGYKFVGWYLDGVKFDFSTKITKDMKLVAKWVKDDATLYTIKFDSNGGNDISDLTVEKNKAVGTLPTPKKTGYKFVGWYIGSKKITKTTIVIKDMNLVAKWEKVENTPKKTVKPVKTTAKVEQTTKKSETTEKVTTKPVEESTTKKPTTKPVVTTKKPTTTKITTTKPVETTTVANDEIGYITPKYKDSVEQIVIYLTKNKKIVSGTCDIVTTTGRTVTKHIGVEGYITDNSLVDTIINIKLD